MARLTKSQLGMSVLARQARIGGTDIRLRGKSAGSMIGQLLWHFPKRSKDHGFIRCRHPIALCEILHVKCISEDNLRVIYGNGTNSGIRGLQSGHRTKLAHACPHCSSSICSNFDLAEAG